MNIIKTRTEYNKMKSVLIDKLSDFMVEYDKFVNSTSPSYWRSTGHFYSEVEQLKNVISKCDPMTYKDLENDFVRSEVLTDEEKELYKNSKKYNL